MRLFCFWNMKKFENTERKGFWIGFIDFFTAGLFLLWRMPGGLQDEIEEVIGKKYMKYGKAYLLGIPDLFIYTLVWMARVSEDLRSRALELGIEGRLTSFRHMFLWNTIGLFFFGPMIATHRFFDTLNKVEIELNKRC